MLEVPRGPADWLVLFKELLMELCLQDTGGSPECHGGGQGRGKLAQVAVTRRERTRSREAESRKEELKKKKKCIAGCTVSLGLLGPGHGPAWPDCELDVARSAVRRERTSPWTASRAAAMLLLLPG